MDKLDICNLGGGAALEIIENAMLEIYENIQDPNTDPEAVRKLNFEVKFKPDTERRSFDMEYFVKVKTAPIRKVKTKAALYKQNGITYAKEFYVDQLSLNFDEERKIIAIND
jgi:hypothetical protein